MDPFRNPFAPGAGSRPPELAGRDDVLSQAKLACGRAVKGRHARSLMLLGLRGTGKTVLLNEISRIGNKTGMLTSKIEAPEDSDLAKLLAPEMRKVMRSLSSVSAAKDAASHALRGLRSFASIFKLELGGVGVGVEPEPGLADSGDIQFDLPDLFEAIGKAAEAAGKGWLLLIDEVQYLSADDLSAIIVSMHRMSQSSLPVVFVGAGLPQVAKLAGEAKSYSERLFVYPEIGALDPDAARRAVEVPIQEEDASIAPPALDEIVERTHGYPFFLQEWASLCWDASEGPQITFEDVHYAYQETIQSLDQGFFKVRLDQLTKSEIAFVHAMARLGDGPYQMSEVAKEMDRKPSSLSPTRASIVKKGTIYSTDHGYIGFTVPLFADFLRRQAVQSGTNP
ncbi:MAG: ATP-binding protein [Pseudomonadota bacterium]